MFFLDRNGQNLWPGGRRPETPVSGGIRVTLPNEPGLLPMNVSMCLLRRGRAGEMWDMLGRWAGGAAKNDTKSVEVLVHLGFLTTHDHTR